MPSDDNESSEESSCYADSENGYDQGALNEYAGFSLPVGISTLPATEYVSCNIRPNDFFKQYIQVRRPAVIKDVLRSPEWQNINWTNSYLTNVAGNTDVLVEDRNGSVEATSFGLSAPKVAMKYRDFIQAIISGEDRYYLTTQDLERFTNDYDEFGLPNSITAQPLSVLSGKFPVQPTILGNLVPYQISLWQGRTGKDQSSSSGLHHDFHDNLYLLLRGRKRFRLFPPSSAPLLHVKGSLRKIHSNGLIVYSTGNNDRCISIRSDGASLRIIAQHRHQRAERDLGEAEEQLQQLRDNCVLEDSEMNTKVKLAEKRVAECEQQLESALEDLLKYDDGISDNEDNYSESDGSSEPTPKCAKYESISSCSQSTSSSDHFSRVQLPVDDKDASTMFAAFDQPHTIGCMIVELNAGEMLYLPASWFHEVTSYDAGSLMDADTAGHLALNYWAYPPDGDCFEQPYRDDFWPQRWAKIRSRLLSSD